MQGFLEYVPGESFFHRLNPVTKIAVAFFLSLSCFLADSHLFVIGVIIINLLIAASSSVFKRTLGILKTLFKLSIVLFLLQIIFIREGNVLIELPLGILITDAGLSFSLLLVLRLIAATMPLAIMISITKMNDLSNALVYNLNIPYKYAFALTTSIRFIPVFMDEMKDIIEAQTARGIEFDTRNILKKIKLILPLCIPLLVSSVKKIESGAISARLRGFNRRERNSQYNIYPFTKLDACSLCLLVSIVFLSSYL